MAFKVGQRVRVIATDPGSDGELYCAAGKEAVILAMPPRCGRIQSTRGWWAECEIAVDGINLPWLAGFHQLAPLTPPAEDTWAADAVRKVTRPQHIEPVKVPQGDEQPTLREVMQFYKSLAVQ